MSTSNDAATEAQPKLNKDHYNCIVHILDGSSLNFSIEKSAKGEVLINKVIQHLMIGDKEYFGLQFCNDKGLQVWLDFHKSMKHQIADLHTELFLRIKFFETEISRVKDEYARYLLYLQTRKDITSGRLLCNEETYAVLGSYTVQAELGDFHHSKFDHSYLDEYEFSPNQSPALINKIKDYHKERRGKTPAQEELNFLEEAKKIDLYGLDTYDAQDVDGPAMIGIGATGIQIYRKQQRELSFRWQNIETLLYNRRKFTVKLKKHLNKSDGNNKKEKLVYVYYFESAKGCKQCYKSAVENHSFYRLTQPDIPRKKSDSLKLRSSFRYSDRTLYQIRHNSNLNKSDRNSKSFQRTPSKRQSSMPLEISSTEPKPAEEEKKSKSPNEISSMEITTDNANNENGEDTPPVQYEEIEIDESNPDDALFDPQDWEVIEKTFQDGTKKRVRRRVIIQTTIMKTIITKQQADTEEVNEEKCPESRETVVVHAEQRSSSENNTNDVEDGSSADPQNNDAHGRDGADELNLPDISMDSMKPNLNMNMDDLLQEICEMSKSLDEHEEVMQEPAKMEIDKVCEEAPPSTPNEEGDQTCQEEAEPVVVPNINIMEEKKMADDLNATLDSIFTLPDYEDEKRHEVHIDANFDDIIIPLESRTVEQQPAHEDIDGADDDQFEYVSVTDAQYYGLDDHDKIQTALLLQQKKDESKMNQGSIKSTDTAGDTHACKEQVVLRRSTLEVNGKPIRHADRQSKRASNAEIIYTVTDVSNVEQGGMGFVRSVTAKHEHIATEEEKSARRSSKVFNENNTTQKGHVPTRTVSFKASEMVIATKSPPAVAVKPTIIVPASSELPDEEIFFTTNQTPEESQQSIEVDFETMKKVPNIETQAVTFDAADDSMDYQIAPVGSDPITVETKVVKITMHTEQSVTSESDASNPTTQVITETVTIESDDPSLTAEELQELIDRTHPNIQTVSTNTHSITNSNVVHVTIEQSDVLEDEDGNDDDDDDEETEI